MIDWDKMDGSDMGLLVRSGQVSSKELVEAAIQRLELVDPRINSVAVRALEQALATSEDRWADEAPFPGVPFLWKDNATSLAGEPMYLGNKRLKEVDYRASADAPLALRFKKAGFVGMGKTNVPEFSEHLTTQGDAYGPCRNPWDPERTVGGSSGGAAAAVAAGIVPIAHGSDSGGSIRVPAAWCGVVGFRPSRGRITLRPDAITSTFTVDHVVTRSIRDTASVLDWVQGPEPGDLFVAPPPTGTYSDEIGAPPRTLRIGLLTGAEEPGIHPEAVVAVERTGVVLEDLGHRVEISGPELNWQDLAMDGSGFGGALDPASMRLHLRRLEAILRRSVNQEDVEPWTWARSAPGRSIRPEDVLLELEENQLEAARIARWWTAGFDILVTPAVAEPAIRLEELVPPADIASIAERVTSATRFRMLSSLTGHPAISLPLHWTSNGLPLGVQLTGDAFREDCVLQLAAQLEEAMPWRGRRPKLIAP